MKAIHENKVADFFRLAKDWYLHDVHTDIAIRCEDASKPILRCHKIIIRDTVKNELGTDISELDDEADEIIIPDFNYDNFDTLIRSLYGVEKKVKEERFDVAIKHESQEITVKIEQEEDDIEVQEQQWSLTDLFAFSDPVGQEDVKEKKKSQPKVYQCEPCDITFEKPYQLNRHKDSKHLDVKYTCCICEKVFARKDKLTKHYKQRHNSEEEKQKIKEANDLMKKKKKEERQELKKLTKKEVSKICPFCSKEFHRNDHMTRHLLIHTGEKPFQCGICMKTYTRKDKLNYHYKNEHRDQVFVCYCSKIFLHEYEFDDHMKANPDHYKEENVDENGESSEDPGINVKVDTEQVEFPSGPDPTICDSYSLNPAYQDPTSGQQIQDGIHLKTERVDTDLNPALPASSQPVLSLSNPGNVRADMKPPKIPAKKKGRKKKKEGVGKPEEETGKHKCEYCDQIFPTLKKRRLHYISDHLDVLKSKGLLFKKNKIAKVKNMICPIAGCEKAFRHKYEVEDHVNFIHHKQRNYVCELCSKSFPYKKNLKGHMELKHDDKKENILCPKCGDIFGSKAKLSAHIQSKHKVKVKKFQCSYCDYKTYLGAYIKEHERMHTGEKPEICQWCGRGFSSKKTLKDHERLHTGEKPFQCKICGKAYAQRTNLRLHVRSSHRIELKDLLKDEPPSDPATEGRGVSGQLEEAPHLDRPEQYRPPFEEQDHRDENVKPPVLFSPFLMNLPMNKLK